LKFWVLSKFCFTDRTEVFGDHDLTIIYNPYISILNYVSYSFSNISFSRT
jgi:hypothetical protein